MVWARLVSETYKEWSGYGETITEVLSIRDTVAKVQLQG